MAQPAEWESGAGRVRLVALIRKAERTSVAYRGLPSLFSPLNPVLGTWAGGNGRQ